MIRDYLLEIPANGSDVVIAAGHYIGFVDSNKPNLSINVRAESDGAEGITDIDLNVGDKLPDLPRYERLHFSNRNNENVLIRVVVGTGRFDSDRLAGQVSINGVVSVDPLPPVGSESYGVAVVIQAITAKHGGFELKNPIGSGVSVLVDSSQFRRSEQSTFYMLKFVTGANQIPVEYSQYEGGTNNIVKISASNNSLVPSKAVWGAFDKFNGNMLNVVGSGEDHTYLGFGAAHTAINESVSMNGICKLSEGDSLVCYSTFAGSRIEGIVNWREISNV